MVADQYLLVPKEAYPKSLIVNKVKNVQDELGENMIEIIEIGDSLELNTQVQVANQIKDVMLIQNAPTIYIVIPENSNDPMGCWKYHYYCPGSRREKIQDKSFI